MQSEREKTAQTCTNSSTAKRPFYKLNVRCVCRGDGQPARSMDRPPLHPVFHITPGDLPTNGAWVAHLGGEPSSCRTWRVECRNLTRLSLLKTIFG
jgi:hypothetical protein